MQANYFQKMPLFSKASKTSLEYLSHTAKRHFYKKNTIILDLSQSKETFLYVVNGWVKLFKESMDGEEIIIDILTKNHHCGEIFLFSFKSEDAYMVESVSDLETFTVPILSFKQLITADHYLALSLLQVILKKQQQLTTHIEHLSIQNAMQRVGCFLLQLCDSPEDQGRITLRLPYDKVLLASHLGMRPETFSRALKKLVEQCAIEVNGDSIDIPQLQNLVQLVCQRCSKNFFQPPPTS